MCMISDIFTLKTPLDALIYLGRLKSELYVLRAYQRLGIDADWFAIPGMAYGWFLSELHDTDRIPPLSKAAENLLHTIDGLGKEINESYWKLAVEKGQSDARCDRAITAHGLY